MEQYLKSKDIPLFLPTYQTLSNRTDRTITLVKPLFPGYLFINIDLLSKSRIHVLQAPGVVKIVSFAGQPISIPAQTIESIMILCGGKSGSAKPHPLVKTGRKVSVSGGPFKGAVGILNHGESKKAKLVVEIEFLGRAVSVPITLDQVTPVF